ncbi:[protein-PII] uridylyltransferase [Jannaschia aquimarina]|uniref:Bifunctional uridylyltransferase/uridylyl-removing enzyme n=1 Tax=Jannaschia aquimarina TaxID=935700 RepID=A0A0D1EAA4_9RHOB|nr:[protein-PII] uridylyltransferase [Jannaschia aquimarina]KIT14619.1 Bifunctional uridylyltransferase/uridylyl-removing enzyme [Jannaschia aquimarina]SNS77703.1 UTP--GlnB (protein PII) uridylyltransferase, GlnD [Jannaschia aquimarina]
MAPASRPAQFNPADFTGAVPDNLIAPAGAIVDSAALASRLSEAVAGSDDPRDVRRAVVALLRETQKSGRAVIADHFAAAPSRARAVTHAYAFLTDRLVQAVWLTATRILHPCPNPTEGERFAILGVGGYGRGEMAPFSDVDLLFLTPTKVTPWVESVVESMLYMLWDLKLKVGHATRTIRECLALGRDDMTIRTSLLEQRAICGDDALPDELRERLWSELFSRTAPEFIEAKLEERAERHIKQGGARYVLEPNVKEAKGGLRDLQCLYWIAKYRYGVEDAADLVPLGVFLPEEFEQFEAAERFVWCVRCHLHLIAGRAADNLTFDMQVEVAERMGYSDHGGRRAVEHFMQAYFRHATKVGELTRILLTALEAENIKQEPGLLGLFKRRPRVKDPYEVRQGRLDVADVDAFLADKFNLLRIFEEALRTGLLLHPHAMRLLTANRHLIDRDMREDRRAAKLFLDLLLKHGDPARALRRMNELDILSAFIPEFAPVVAMMQFNLYHRYTVDEHTIQVVSNLAQIERGELYEDLPLCSGILKTGVNRRVLYVACLLHDIGKGRPEDHSILGARIARDVAPRLGLKPAECETVEWLVRHHLLMSDMSQKRDIADPRTIRDFAKAVTTRERLDLLTVLTVCDIRGVGPHVWNNWKAQMLRALHRATSSALENGLEDVNRTTREAKAKRLFREALPDWSEAELRAEIGRHYGPYWQGIPTAAQVRFAHLLRDLPEGDVRLELDPDEERDATRAVFAMHDHPGIFSRLAGALSLAGANIVDARSYTTKDGFATSVFWLQDGAGHPYEAARLPRLRDMIEKILRGEVATRQALEGREIKKRLRGIEVPTHISFDNDGSEIYTIIEVDTRDRPGLLYDLTQAMAAANIQISQAVIATYGAQVVDAFYVKDIFGLKIWSRSKQEALERRLRDAITRAKERAGA